jgi:hypothetical protein
VGGRGAVRELSCDANQGKDALLIVCESFLDSGRIAADTEQFKSLHKGRTVIANRKIANRNVVSSVV